MTTIRITLFMIVAHLVLSPAASAQVEIVGGWEGSRDRGYLFLMPVATLLDRPTFALLTRGSVSHLYYTFPELGTITEVTSPGASAGIALRWKTKRAAVTLGPGYELRRTKRVTGGISRDIDERGLTLQGDIFFQPDPLDTLFVIAAYGEANEYTWSRAGYKRQVTNRSFRGPGAISVGIELTAQGNRDLRTYQAGPMLEIAFLRAGGSVQLRGGLSKTEYDSSTEESKQYFGIGFYRRF